MLASGSFAGAILLGGCTDSTPDEPISTRPGTVASDTERAEEATTRPTIAWDYPQVDGYSLSDEPPAETVVELKNPDAGCVLQLGHERLPDQVADDAAYTRTAIENVMSSLGATGEADRQRGTISTGAGPLAATEVSFTAASGPQELDVRLMLRASADDGVLVGIVHICPTGGIDEAVWSRFVDGVTLHGTTATGLSAGSPRQP
ncbi:hypothetical protein GCM10023169_32550 [Georgenia halophila]|uniref:DUF1795 domain-containing protein n=1 Tax=Georgenia halophila TaxID=620889 RepID=A0ABP8LHJ3_9MICO